ncbi:FMN-binding glutamate synthase family protein [Aliikangiella coralliicola]|uniref:FMN-binding glutamate synthase family protein n=1 Tax=Aliikangiella coralliicola TaxID=2592383 RepID=A0A545U7V6_9GAMM|nr:FMN-binding glutamate synthase family protein [Aliikangiella coralliicola]TQV85560.1 FMN-binding glutamate synthase family protein [Aliikangiella coralliicola]
MLSQETQTALAVFFQWAALLFVIAVGIGVATILVVYVFDRLQTTHAVKRNYPVIGRFRYWFEHLGEFFRQYFFAMDREELPFNRAQRSWVYRAAKNIDNTIAFGSTRDTRKVGNVLFVNCPYPTMKKDAVSPRPVTIGENTRHPWTTSSFFGVSAMSFGAISEPAVKALSYGAAKAGTWLNTGEGGLSPYHLKGGADIVFQIGTAKYGVRDEEGNLNDDKLREVAGHEQVRLFEIKLSQGAKPGKGGILPGEKVTEEIAKIRGIRVGEDSISPNRHPDINSNEDLINMVNHVREVTGKPVGFKAVVGSPEWLDDLMLYINERGAECAPDFITLDSADGGTGAAPMTLMDDMGLTIRETLPMLIDALHRHGLRERIKVFTSGKMVNPADVAWALCVGADFCNSARGFMFALGCIQSLQCNKNTCPTGIATHDKKLQRGLVPRNKSERVAHYAKNMMYAVGIIAHSCGVKEPRELGRQHARVICDNGLSVGLNDLYKGS